MNRKLIMACLLLAAAWLAACSANTPAPAATTAPAAATSTLAANVQPTSAAAPTVAQPTAAAPTTVALATATAAPTSASAAPPANSADFLVNAQKAFITKKVRVNITTTNSASNKTSQSTIEFQPPDAIHMSESSAGTEFIIIKGQGTWMKEGDTWTKFPVDMSSAIPNIFDPNAIADLQKSVNTAAPQFAGPDIVDGKPTFVYTYSETVSSAVAGKDYTTQNKIWIGVTDGLPYKAESTVPDPVTPGATNHTVITYQYDDTINIQPPTP